MRNVDSAFVRWAAAAVRERFAPDAGRISIAIDAKMANSRAVAVRSTAVDRGGSIMMLTFSDGVLEFVYWCDWCTWLTVFGGQMH